MLAQSPTLLYRRAPPCSPVQSGSKRNKRDSFWLDHAVVKTCPPAPVAPASAPGLPGPPGHGPSRPQLRTSNSESGCRRLPVPCRVRSVRQGTIGTMTLFAAESPGPGSVLNRDECGHRTKDSYLKCTKSSQTERQKQINNPISRRTKEMNTHFIEGDVRLAGRDRSTPPATSKTQSKTKMPPPPREDI